MLKITLLGLVLYFGSISIGYSQQEKTENFKFYNDERKISWIKIYEIEPDIDFKTLKNYFSENRLINIISESDSSFNGEFIKRPIDLRKYGYSRSTTPTILIDMEQIFNVTLEFKQGRYRVTLNDLGYIDNGVMSDMVRTALIGYTPTTSKGNVESYNGDFSFTKNNEVRQRISKIFEILDIFYQDILMFKKVEKSSDW